MNTSRRVVITGLGLSTPVGMGREAVWNAVLNGQTGIARIQSYDPSPFPVQFGGEIPDFDAKLYVDKKARKSLKHMSRTVQLGVSGAKLALDDARLEAGAGNPDRFGVVYGTGTIPGDLHEVAPSARAGFDRATDRVDMSRWGAVSMQLMPPMWLLFHVPNMAACHVAILNDARGPNNTITQSSVASLLAIGEAVRMIRRGTTDVMLAGGADTRIDILSMVRCPLFIPMSRRNDDPEQAMRPFDRHRSGQVLGEGAGVLVLEELEHARGRGAKILAEIVGFSAGVDRGCQGGPLARMIHRTLTQAEITPSELDHVNTLAPGTATEDAWEARALQAALPDVPVVSYKPNFAHLGAAADAAELGVSLQALEQGVRPGTRNYTHPDPDCPVAVATETAPVRGQYVLKLGGTERGQCAALIVRKWD